MAENTGKSQLENVAEVLQRHGVEFIVIGGQAESILGSARVTYDTDLCYRRLQDNLERLAPALKELEVTLRNAPKDSPFAIDARSLALGDNFTFDTRFGSVDFLGYVEPLGGYDELIRNAEAYLLGDLTVNVISLDDLITIKRHIQRPKDQDSLRHLLAIKQVREERGEA